LTRPNIPATTHANWATLAGLIAGGGVGLVVALFALDPLFIAGTGGKWIRPENDYVAYFAAWNYYVRDQWRLPLFNLPLMGYPEGGSVIFNDALPLTALATKLLYRSTGLLLNPFGWWIFLTYVFQGVAAARVMQAVGVRSVWASICAAALSVVSIAFLARMGHTALSTHVLVLWAISLYFWSLRQKRFRYLEATALLTITLLVNTYLFAMVFPLVALTVVTLGLQRRLGARDAARLAVIVAVLLVLGAVSGYGILLTNPVSMKSEGFGKYSWNIATLLVPPEGILGFGTGMIRDATHGQYEGEAFVGRGALLVLVFVVLSSPQRVWAAVGRYRVFVAGLVLFAIYAASNRIYAGGSLLATIDLPQPLLELGGYFRATGRFIWPMSYSLALLPLAGLFRWSHRGVAVAISGLALVVQVFDAAPGIEYRRALTTRAHVDLIDEALVGPWIREHERIWQFPSWDCGGLVGSNRRWPSDDSNRELQLQLAASRAGVPMNSIYMSRTFKNCATEGQWGQTPVLEPGVLYILGPPATVAHPAFKGLLASASCRALPWATFCSTKFAEGRMAQDTALAAELPRAPRSSKSITTSPLTPLSWRPTVNPGGR
jgi:hypothetical protein